MGRGKHSCVNLTVKVAKHEKVCSKNQHVFALFAFDTFGFLAPEAVNFLNRVQRFMNNNITTPRTQKNACSRIVFAIQKGYTATSCTLTCQFIVIFQFC
ncbi:hypothetical protein R6Q57_001878 [Mikania cordata]